MLLAFKDKVVQSTVPNWVRIPTVNMIVHDRGCCADDILYSQQKDFEGTLWVVPGVV